MTTETTTTETVDTESTILTDQGEQTSQENKTEEVKDSGEVQPKAPEKYDFVLDEGFTLDKSVVERFDPVFRKLDLTNEQANELAAEYARIQKAGNDSWEAEVTGWGEAVKNDPEIGGENFSTNAASATRVIGLFGTPELRTFLNQTGYGNHPELVRVFARIGKAFPKEDTVVQGDPTGSAPRSIEERLYGNRKP